MAETKKMTCRELLAIEHPDKVYNNIPCGSISCPELFGYSKNRLCEIPNEKPDGSTICTKCWNQPADEEAVKRVIGTVDKLCEVGNVNPAFVEEVKQAIYKAAGLPDSLINHLETDENIKKQADTYVDMMKSAGPIILDSGDRTEFPSGAVRDCHEGKGDMVSIPWEALLRLSVHYERGAKKYERWNFRKGIPISSFIDSACRHLAKYQCGCDDEDHLAAAAFNVLGAMLMENTKPEMNDLPSREGRNTFDYFKKDLQS